MRPAIPAQEYPDAPIRIPVHRLQEDFFDKADSGRIRKGENRLPEVRQPETARESMADLTQSELKAVCRVLAHFLDGGWILESLHTYEESERFFDDIESAQEKLSRMSRDKVA
jgi:hypothetical protein